MVRMAQRQLGVAPEGQPGIGGQHALGGALQQPGRQLAFESADLLAQGRGDDTQGGRSLAEAAVFDDLDEVAKLAKFHGWSFPRDCGPTGHVGADGPWHANAASRLLGGGVCKGLLVSPHGIETTRGIAAGGDVRRGGLSDSDRPMT